jgi:microsomal dipeptidase-like Zn-dependent dipeptidase
MMRDGDVRVGFSVLYLPTAEFQILHWSGRPRKRDFRRLVRQLEEVEKKAGDGLRFAHDLDELEAGIESPDAVLVHCVEGGFQLGKDARAIERNLPLLKERGVVYVTLAHLFWRQVATNANALPFMRDDQYHCLFLFHEPDVGLTDLGRAAVRKMAECRMLVDISHMSRAAIRDTFDELRKVEDEKHPIPVLATHVATRRGVNGLDYNIDADTAREVARRGGVIGLIMGDHIVTDGLRPDPERCGAARTKDFDDSLDCLCTHIETLRDWCGGYDNIGIGSDLDGFIKPTLAGIETVRDMGGLERALAERYRDQPGVAKGICGENALRLLREYVWG